MRVLVACEYSGIVRDAFTALGHDAMSCDILPTESDGPHYQGDVFDVLCDGWDLMVAHPPCTYLCNSGFHNTYRTESKELCGHERWKALIDGAVFFRNLLEADIPRIAVENPVMVGWAAKIIGRRQDQVIQPWQYGHGEKKGTGLWLKNLPPLRPTEVLPEVGPNGEDWRAQNVWLTSPGADRSKLRSRFFEGVAAAMAEQWGGDVRGSMSPINDIGQMSLVGDVA